MPAEELAATPSLDVLGIIFGGLGGLALFLYGMHKMSDGLQAVAGDSMKALLSKLTTNRFMAAVTGAIVTAVLQSSSITTVLVVGFVSAGLMTLAQTVGIIMGANVGTTITAQMLAFNITDYAWLMIAIGFASWGFAKRDMMRNMGTLLMGFGMLFIGMGQMGDATGPLRTHPPFIELMSQMDNVLLAMLVGAIFTALVQSSSATIGIVIVLATQGHITLTAGIALAIGAKIGTCVTAVLAGIGKAAQARQVGIVHVLFNVLGALIWLPFIDQLGAMATAVSPLHPDLEGVERLAAETPRQVANAITIFAAINLCVMIWFTRPVAWLARKIVPERVTPEPERIKPKYLEPVFLRTPALAIEQLRLELIHLGELVDRMLVEAPDAVVSGDHADLDHIVKLDDDVDIIHAEILKYIATLSREELTTHETRQLETEIDIANNLEALGDLIETNLVAQGRRRLEHKIEFVAGERQSIRPLYDQVVQSLRDVLKALETSDADLAREIIDRKELTAELATSARGESASEMRPGDSKSVIQFRIEADIVNQVTRLFYHVRRIAKAIAKEQETR